MESKNWYQSSTIQSVVVIVAVVLFQMLFGGDDAGQTIDSMTKTATENKDLIMQLMTLGAGGVAIRGRLKANTTIKPKKGGSDNNG